MDRTAIIAGLACLAALAGCARKPVTVGSKNFTEQVILGEIVAQQLERRLDGRVDRKLNLGGTLLTHQALITGGIDVYPEYTGTALTSVLKETVLNDPAVVYDRVRTRYLENWKVEWLPPLGFDNPFAMVVRGADARRLEARTLSDAARPGLRWRLGAGYEFLERPDGMAALNREYRLEYDAATKSMDLGLLYRALEQDQVSLVAGNATDGLLASRDFVVLEDDKRAFPPYQACLAVNGGALESEPRLRAALAELSGKISTAAMRKMNRQVDGEHRPVREVAAEWLRAAVWR